MNFDEGEIVASVDLVIVQAQDAELVKRGYRDFVIIVSWVELSWAMITMINFYTLWATVVRATYYESSRTIQEAKIRKKKKNILKEKHRRSDLREWVEIKSPLHQRNKTGCIRRI